MRRIQPVVASSVIGTLRRCGFGMRADRDLIDDLVQQTFLRLCGSGLKTLQKQNFTSEGGFFAYVRTMAANITIDYLRRPAPPFQEISPSLQELRPEPVDSSVILASIDTHLKRCSDTNYERDRRVFWLYYRSGLTSKTIAAIPLLGLTQKGVESLILRLTRCIRGIFSERLRVASKGKPVGETSYMGGRTLGTAG